MKYIPVKITELWFIHCACKKKKKSLSLGLTWIVILFPRKEPEEPIIRDKMDVVSHAWVDLKDNVSGAFLYCLGGVKDRYRQGTKLRLIQSPMRLKLSYWRPRFKR